MSGVYVTYWEEELLFVWVESGKQLYMKVKEN